MLMGNGKSTGRGMYPVLKLGAAGCCTLPNMSEHSFKTTKALNQLQHLRLQGQCRFEGLLTVDSLMEAGGPTNPQ